MSLNFITQLIADEPISPVPNTFEARLGRVDEVPPYMPITSDKSKTAMWESWQAFHEGMPYTQFRQFYSKEQFCDDILELPLTREQFIQVISDRAFLFPEYSSHLAPPEYPTLLAAYFNVHEAVQLFGQEKTEFIQAHGFMPTNELWNEWRLETQHEKALQEAIERRKTYTARGHQLPLQETLEISDNPFQVEQATELEKKLGRLFVTYLNACMDMAYCHDYKSYTQEAYRNAIPWIHAIIANNSNTNVAGNAALWVWILFTTFTTKLASGKLKKLVFRLAPSKQMRKDDSPARQQGTQSMKTKCNIILFDHLLDLLPTDDPEYTKFQFYALTQYNRFPHYKTIPVKPYDFSVIEKPMDCVDQLGGLINYHIDHCLMNTPAWLTLAVPSLAPKPLMNSLTALLLHDATITPTKYRLTDCLRILMDDKVNAEAYITAYVHCSTNPEQKTNLLDRMIAENNLHFNASHVFADGDTLNDPNIRQCERFVVEYFLKESVFGRYRSNLREKAKSLFPAEWFLSEHVFSE